MINNFIYLRLKNLDMKKFIFALMMVSGALGYSVSYAQDSTKADKKLRKVIKKENKGKHNKAMKKAYKMVKKDEKDK